jgi:hypothetical protein
MLNKFYFFPTTTWFILCPDFPFLKRNHGISDNYLLPVQLIISVPAQQKFLLKKAPFKSLFTL